VKAKNVLIAVSVLVLVLTAFFLGQRTQVEVKKKTQVKKVVQPRIVKKKKAAVLPSAVIPSRVAKVAIVIDDFGYSKNNLPAFFDIKEPLTFSILPNLRYSRDIAKSAKEHGCEAILHLPMASHRKDVVEEIDTLKPGDSQKEIIARLSKDIESVPGLDGVSNHMGSLATEDKTLMTTVLAYLKKHNLYFFDSVTSDKSVCADVAGSTGIKFAKRDIFLDNSNDVDRIAGELAELKKLAFKRGRAIAICHDRKNTAIALAKVMPQMAEEGIEFVCLSDMVR